MKLFPWWLKIAVKIVLTRLPFGYAVWQRLGLFRHGQMDSSEYALRVFNSHREKAGLSTKSLKGKIVLELGPGDSIATAIIAYAYGAKAILVDTGNFVRFDISSYTDLLNMLSDYNLTPPNLSGCITIDSILARCNARYLTEGIKSLVRIESASVDLIFSQAVLEHVRKKEFLETTRECRRILKSNGICSHQIDLRDHLSDALNNLRFSERVWESEIFAKSGFYTNRIRYSQMLGLFVQAGFQVDVTILNRWASLPTPRNKLAKEFKDLKDKELCVSIFDIVLR